MRSSLLAAAAVALLLVADTARAAPGDPDASFSGDGRADRRPRGRSRAGRTPSRSRRNGAIVVGGRVPPVRRRPDRRLRARPRATPAAALQTQTTDIDGGDDHALAVAFNRFSDKIVLSGYTKPKPGVTHNEFATRPLQRGGSPRPRVQPATARRRVDFGTGAIAQDVAVDSNLRIVAGGGRERGRRRRTTSRSPASVPPTARYDNELLGRRQADHRPGAASSRPTAVAVEPDGQIVVAGRAAKTKGDFDLAVARYRRLDGSPDTSFRHRPASVTTDFGAAPTAANGIAIQPDGKIVVAGHDRQGDFAVARYNTDGTLDTSFSSDGKLTRTSAAPATTPRGVAVQADGKIVVAGPAVASTAARDFALARYNPDGTLDASFAGDGRKTTDLGSNDLAAALALQPDGRIVLAGLRSQSGRELVSRSPATRARLRTPTATGSPTPATPARPSRRATANGCPGRRSRLQARSRARARRLRQGGATGRPRRVRRCSGDCGKNVFRAGAGDDRLTGGPLADLLCRGEAGSGQTFDGLDGRRPAVRGLLPRAPGWRRWPARATTCSAAAPAATASSAAAATTSSAARRAPTASTAARAATSFHGRHQQRPPDRRRGDRRRAAGGAGRNRYTSSAGNDKVSAVNGKRDRVDCGAGRRDSARVDRRDRVKGCERVRRR